MYVKLFENLPRLCALALAVVCLSLCAGDCDPDWPPNTLMETADGEPLRPIVLPWEVCLSNSASEIAVEAEVAAENWQRWARMDEVPRDWMWMLPLGEPCDERTLGQIYIEVGVPEDPEAYAEAEAIYNLQGDIRYCTVVMAFDWTWADTEWIVLWLTHELGHCMGLGHARGGSGSIMESPTPPDGVLLPYEFELLLEGS